jgi:hypothetical protein
MELWMEVSQKLKLELPFDLEIPPLSIYLKEGKSGYNKDTCTPMIFAALLILAKLWKQPRSLVTDECPVTFVIHIQWNIINHKEMKFCHLQINEWNWRPPC